MTMIPYIVEAELILTEFHCTLSGNALAQEWREASHAESLVMERMMSVLHEELERPLIDGGWKATAAKGVFSTARDLGVRTIPGGKPRKVGKQLSFDGTPFVNIAVNITAPGHATDRILKRIDWQRIERALKS